MQVRSFLSYQFGRVEMQMRFEALSYLFLYPDSEDGSEYVGAASRFRGSRAWGVEPSYSRPMLINNVDGNGLSLVHVRFKSIMHGITMNNLDWLLPQVETTPFYCRGLNKFKINSHEIAARIGLHKRLVMPGHSRLTAEVVKNHLPPDELEMPGSFKT